MLQYNLRKSRRLCAKQYHFDGLLFERSRARLNNIFLLKAMWQDGVSSGRQVLFGYFLRRQVKSDKTKFKL